MSNSTDRQMIDTLKGQKKSLEEYAKSSRTFDDALTNTINMFKTALLPFIDTFNKEMIPKIDNFVKNAKTQGWFDKIGELAKSVGEIVSFMGKAIMTLAEYPKTILGLFIGAKVFGFLYDATTWFKNGLILAEGFNVGTGKGFTSIADGFIGKFVNSMGIAGKLLGGIAGTAIGGVVGNMLGGSASKALGFKSSTTGDVFGAIGGLAGGAIGGAELGAAIGSVVPGLGTVIGAGIGALAGGFLGKAGGDIASGLITGDRLETTPQANDAIVQNGKITPIDSKDDLIAMKPGGMIDKTIGSSTTGGVNEVKHTFGDLNINGQLVVTTPGGGNIGVDLLKDPAFVRSMTIMVTNEVRKMNNGGKV